MGKGLTLKDLELLNTASAYNGEQHKAICGKAAIELIEYKKIEEELGIDLITLFKALRDSMWFKYYNKELDITFIWDAHCYMKPLLNVYNKTIEIKEYVDNGGGYWFIDKDVVYIKDYGKTWALTKEELL